MRHSTCTLATSSTPPPCPISTARSLSPTSPSTSQARSSPPHPPLHCMSAVFNSIHAVPWTPFGDATTVGETWTRNFLLHGLECQG